MDQHTKKRMKIMLISMTILFGCIIGYKVFMGIMMQHYMAAFSSPVITVSTMKVENQPWQPRLTAAGGLRAIRGVNVTTQLAGMVTHIYFKPGQDVEENAVLVQLNADDDIALLHALEADANLAAVTYNRDKAQYKLQAISKAVLDADAATLNSSIAKVAQQAAIVEKKTIRAPFAGRLGICNINPGQFLNPGDTVTMLQTLDPIYVDFYVPQQSLALLKLNQPVAITTETFSNRLFTGKVTTINPGVDVDTRNVLVEATIDNPKHELAPGMYVKTIVTLGEPQNYLTLPQTAVTFNPYGQLVYLVKETGKDQKGPILIATQSFVTTGETRGDQVVILQGLKEGETVVTSGQLKLKNGSRIVVNNAIQPPNNPAPHLPNNH
ncbi:MAG TPA: efflux RND transporter periplasmic adaptor subunit [Gammaproteobacteria bacterium]|nr:efflux RND transporter periplasmic adaptor subunit [Gammaproteobacteria bacterium]